MINNILNTINDTLTGYTKLYCLLERREGDTIEYSGGGSFSTIPFDEYAVGGYWRLRSSVNIEEREGSVACSKKQILTYPLYFVVWFKRDEIDESPDDFVNYTVGAISSLRSSENQVRTRVMGWETDKQKEESGKDNDAWTLVRISVDVIFTKNCPTTCSNIVDICLLNGAINGEAIGEFFSDFNITVEDSDGNAVGSWDGEKWVVPAAVGGDVVLDVNGVEFTTITAPDTFDLPVIQDGSPVGSKVGSDWVVPSCADADWTLKDTSGDTLNSGSIASGGSEDITAPDANYSLDNTDGTELSTGVIESGGSETIVAPDAQVFSNNTAGSLPGTTNVPSGAFTNITYPDASVTVDDQDGNELAQQDVPSGVSSTIVVTVPEYDLSITQAPLTVDIDENKTLTVRDSAGNSFLSSQVSASESVNDVFVDLADYKATVQGLTPNIYNVLRTDSPSFRLFDTDGTQISIDSIDDSANPIFDVTLANIPLQVNSGVEGALKLGWDLFNILLEDPSGATVTPDSIDTGTAKQVTIEVPALALDVSLAIDDTNPTVGEEITATVTVSGADSFCVSFGNGTAVAGTSATANNTYMIPGVYTVGALAGIDATGVGGAVPDGNKVDVTVDGILDTYLTSAFIATAPVLLQRLYAGNGLEVRKTGPGGTSDFGYTDGILDDFTTYVGSGNGFVRTLYNQVGNDFVQTNNADQPQIINSGTLLTNPYGGWVMRFDGSNDYLQATREDFWPVGDRTKLFMAFAFSCNNGTNSTQILLSQFEYSTGNNRCFRTWYDGVDEELNVQYSTDGTNTTYQTINFSGISLNEFAVVIVQIDTSETVNDRIKAWKFDDSGETSLTREGTTGNQSGNLYNSTADVLIGAQNPSSPAAFFSGDLSPHFILAPELLSTSDRQAVGQYMFDCISDSL